MDILALAFLHASPRGMHYVADAGSEQLRNWEEPEALERWPAGWVFDPAAFKTGVDFTSPEATEEDVERIQQWYQDTLGEVPRYVRFLARHRPRLLKAYRSRFEYAVRDALPSQMVAYSLLNLSVARRSAEGIRENVLLGRGLGMTKAQLLDAICWGLYYGGVDGLAVADAAAADILDSMT
jgi:hypothetical protein